MLECVVKCWLLDIIRLLLCDWCRFRCQPASLFTFKSRHCRCPASRKQPLSAHSGTSVIKKNTIYKEKYFPFPSWPDSWHIQMYSQKVKKKKPNILVCCLLKECITQTSGCTSTFILWRWQCHTDLFLFFKRWIDRDYFVFLYFFWEGVIHNLELNLLVFFWFFLSSVTDSATVLLQTATEGLVLRELTVHTHWVLCLCNHIHLWPNYVPALVHISLCEHLCGFYLH